MELPPEQLIRLLGLETKKIRKGKSNGGRPRDRQPVATPQNSDAPTRETQPARTNTFIPPIPRSTGNTAPETGARRSGFLFPAVVTGVVAGLAVAAYLFWSTPPVATALAPATKHAAEPGGNKATSATPAVRPSEKPQATRQPARSGNSQPVPLNPEKALQAVMPPVSGDPVADIDPQRQAAIDAELARLRDEAEQRFATEISRIEASRELDELRPLVPGSALQETSPGSAVASEGATLQPLAAEPAPDQPTPGAGEPGNSETGNPASPPTPIEAQNADPAVGDTDLGSGVKTNPAPGSGDANPDSLPDTAGEAAIIRGEPASNTGDTLLEPDGKQGKIIRQPHAEPAAPIEYRAASAVPEPEAAAQTNAP